MAVRPVRRALAVLVSLWFALVTVEPAAVHACPIHGAPSAVVAGLTGASEAAHDHAGADDANQQHPARHDCACLGDCSASSVSAGVVASHVQVVPVALTRVGSGFPSPAPWAAHDSEFLQPYANGPPPGLPIA